MDNNSANLYNIVDNTEHDCKEKKAKDSILLLKQKMCKTNDLIKQYSENMKQINHLKSDLDTAKKKAKQIMSNYEVAMDKTRELELKIGENKKINEDFENKIDNYEINVAADKQNIQQLTCKIKYMENEKISFEDKIKELEHELKKSKVTQVNKSVRKKKEKKIISNVDVAIPNIDTKSSSDIDINVSLCDLELKPKYEDKSILTDEFYNMKDDPHPLFCARCEAHLSPDLTPEKICKTMSAFPKLIEKDLSPLKKSISPYSLPSMYPESVNRNEDALSRISMPQLSPYSDTIIDNPKSEQSSIKLENVALKNGNVSHSPIETNFSNNLGSVPTALILSQDRNSARGDFCSDNLLAKHSSSIKELERKIRILEIKLKRFRRLKEKTDNSCCHKSCCGKSSNNDISLNSNLISIICKGMAEYYEEKRQTCCKKKQDIDSEMCTCSTRNVSKLKRRQHLDKNDTNMICKNSFPCKIENHDKNKVRDTFYNKESTRKAIDISQRKNTLSVHRNNMFSNKNTSNMFHDNADEFDKRQVALHEKDTLHSAEVASIEDNLITSHLSADEMYASDDSLDKDNMEAIDNQTETEMIFLSNDENSTTTDHADAEENIMKNKAQNMHKNTDGKIVNINAEKNEIESNSQKIHEDKIGERYITDNLSSIDSVGGMKQIDNQTETGTIFLSNENSTGHADDKVVDINAEVNVQSKAQNIRKDKIDEICASDDLLNKDNGGAIDMDNQTKTGRTLRTTKNENSTVHPDGKIIKNDVEERIIKTRCQSKCKVSLPNKNKVGDRILKKIRSLKRKKLAPVSLCIKQENIESCPDSSKYSESAKKLCVENEKKSDDLSLKSINLKRNLDTRESINKQDNNKACSDDYEPAKKLRIAHIPKTSVPQSSVNENTHSTMRNIVTVMTRQNNGTQQLNAYTRKDLLTKTEEISNIINEKCEEKNVKSIGTNGINESSINEKDFDLTSGKGGLQNNVLSAINIERVSKFKLNNVSIEDTINRNISMDRIGETSSNDSESIVLHNNNANSVANNFKLEESIPMEQTCMVTQSESSILDKDSKHGSYTQVLETKKEIAESPIAELEYACEILGNENNSRKISKDAISNGESVRNKSHNNSDSNGTTQVVRLSSLRENDIVEDSINNSNATQSLNEVKNTDKQETCINNETVGMWAIETRRRNVRTSQQGKETKSIDIPHHIEEPRSHNNSDISDETTQVLCSSSLRDSGTIFENCTNDNYISNTEESLKEINNTRNTREKTYVNNETIEIPIQRKDLCVSQQEEERNVSYEDEKESQTPMSQLMKRINPKITYKKYKITHKQIKKNSKIIDKFIKKQLRRLLNSAWEETIYDDITEKLKTCGPRIIAKGILEFLLEEVDYNDPLDKSFTPPAPMMTTFEQKIITLLFDLQVSKPTVIYFVQAAIEYRMFNLQSTVKFHQVSSLTRIYVALSRIQKNREKVRIMCCDALYCMGLKSIDVLHTILICWPEILPNAETNKGILPKCIAFLIGSWQIEKVGPNMKQSFLKLKVLKNCLSTFHKYNYNQVTTIDIVKELMTTLQATRIDGLDTAIILISKREGPSWTYKNIIRPALLPMIIRNEHPCIFSAFSLLGKLLRVFPSEDKDNAVKDISEQLCDLIKSGQGSHDQQEGIISAMLSLSRQKFHVVAPFVLEWIPSKPLRPTVDAHLQGFINRRKPVFWKKYLNKLKH